MEAPMATIGTAALFDRLACRYDAWYDGPAGRVAFPLELGCLAPLLAGSHPPRLEVGVGSGRFAAALAAEVGVDPAVEPLRLARSRGVAVVQGVGEQLPFRDGVFGAVLVVLTLCFADNPGALLVQARRVLRADGRLVLGTVFADSSWGRSYQQRAEHGDPFYAAARFLTRPQLTGLLTAAGLTRVAARSTLLQPPSDRPHPEPVRDTDQPQAGFVAWQVTPIPPC
jgi:SAM-dependent methyltransferase